MYCNNFLLGTMTQFYLKPTYKYNFDQIRAKLGELFVVVSPIIEKAVTLGELKKYLRMCFPELKPQLSKAESFDDVMDIVREKCSIINIACLEAIIDHYKIEKAKPHITSYNLQVEAFCQSVELSVYETEDLMPNLSSQPEYEIIEFVLDWMMDEHTFSEINGLLCKAFGSMAKRVLVTKVKKGNSIIITCYASCFIVDDLLIEVKTNLGILKEMGLIKVTIGSNTIWGLHARDKV